MKEEAQTLQIQFFFPAQPFYFHSLRSPPFYCFPFKTTEVMLTNENNDLTRMPPLQLITPVSRETKNAAKNRYFGINCAK
ncbi:hypothetical protein AAGG52_24260 [Bacillus licheniformis]